MKLDPESLDVTSFDTTAASANSGPVVGNGNTEPTWCADCIPPTTEC